MCTRRVKWNQIVIHRPRKTFLETYFFLYYFYLHHKYWCGYHKNYDCVKVYLFFFHKHSSIQSAFIYKFICASVGYSFLLNFGFCSTCAVYACLQVCHNVRAYLWYIFIYIPDAKSTSLCVSHNNNNNNNQRMGNASWADILIHFRTLFSFQLDSFHLPFKE